MRSCARQCFHSGRSRRASRPRRSPRRCRASAAGRVPGAHLDLLQLRSRLQKIRRRTTTTTPSSSSPRIFASGSARRARSGAVGPSSSSWGRRQALGLRVLSTLRPRLSTLPRASRRSSSNAPLKRGSIFSFRFLRPRNVGSVAVRGARRLRGRASASRPCPFFLLVGLFLRGIHAICAAALQLWLCLSGFVLALLMRSCVTQTLLRVRCTRAITTHVSGKMHACAVPFCISPVELKQGCELHGLYQTSAMPGGALIAPGPFTRL